MEKEGNDTAWIIGIVLVVIVAVILAAAVALVVDRTDPNPPDQKHMWLDTESFESNGSDSLTIIHKSGDNLSGNNLTVTIRGSINERTGEPYAAINGRHNLTSLRYKSGSYLKPNDTITLNKSTLGVEDEINFETADVFIKHTGTYIYNWNGSEATKPE